MANIKSAQKRILTNKKKKLQNRMLKSSMQTALKKFYTAINNNEVDTAEKLLPETISLVDSMASKGIIHKNNASSKVAHMSMVLNNLKSGKLVIVKEEKRYKKKLAQKEEAAPAPAPVVEEKPAKAKKAVKEPKAEKEEKPAKEKKAKEPKAEKEEKPKKAKKAE